MNLELAEVRLRSALLTAIWASATLLLAWHANADVAIGDSGEIGGAAFALGVAHPTGFPLDMLWLRAFELLPLGSLAWRENLAVSTIAAGAVTGIAALTLRLAERLSLSLASAAVGALVAASGLAAFQTFLESALSVEVYSTALALVILAALVLLDPPRRAAIYPIFGLCFGAHVTAGLLMLPLLAAAAISGKRQAIAPRRWLPIALSALVVAYLPLASRRDSAFDWGDPETWPNLFAHLSAARIRDAYSADMFANRGGPNGALFGQLFEHPWLYPPALLGLFALSRKGRPLALVLLSVLSLDLGYAVWVNPMGIAARQLGHASGAALALLAGLGAAQLIDSTRARSKLLGLAAVGGGLVASLYLVLGAAWPARADGYAIAERYGATSPLLALRPRSVYLCSSDSACASALFAIYVEAVRPDIAVAPAQHLWDETVTRRLDGLLPASSPPPSAAERRRRADSQFIALLEQAGQRPIALELAPPMAAGVGYDNAPFLEVRARDRSATDDDPELALRALERARFGSAGPKTQLARVLWSSAHADVGTALLYENRFESGLICLRRALELTPERAVAHSNLGVALEKQGDFAGALAETRRAVEIDPARPTPWLNLARLMLRMTGREAALSVLRAADESAVRDPRLTELRAALH